MDRPSTVPVAGTSSPQPIRFTGTLMGLGSHPTRSSRDVNSTSTDGKRVGETLNLGRPGDSLQARDIRAEEGGQKLVDPGHYNSMTAEGDLRTYSEQIRLIQSAFDSVQSPVKIFINNLSDLYALQYVIQERKGSNSKILDLEIKDGVLECLKYLSENKKSFDSVECVTVNSIRSPEVLDVPDIAMKKLFIIINTSYSIMIDKASTVEWLIVAQSLDLSNKIEAESESLSKLNSLLIGELRNLRYLSVSCKSNLFLDLSKYSDKLEKVEITCLGTIVINESQKKLYENGAWIINAREIKVSGPSGGTSIEISKENSSGVRFVVTPNSSPKPGRAVDRKVVAPMPQLKERSVSESPSGSFTSGSNSPDRRISPRIDNLGDLELVPQIPSSDFRISGVEVSENDILMNRISSEGLDAVIQSLTENDRATLQVLEMEGFVPQGISEFIVQDKAAPKDYYNSDAYLGLLRDFEEKVNVPSDGRSDYQVVEVNGVEYFTLDYSKSTGLHMTFGKSTDYTAYLSLSRELVWFVALAMVLMYSVQLMQARSTV